MPLVRFPAQSAWIVGFLLCFVGAACTEDGAAEDPTAKATIASFTTSEESLVEGEAVTLAWTTRNAKSVSLVANGYVLPHEDLPLSGEMEVSPTGDTTYRLEAVGRNGSMSSKEVRVEVEPFGPPGIEAFEASSAGIARGDTLTLSWKTKGAASIMLSAKGGKRFDLGKEAASEGSIDVGPVISTTYVLEARNSSGTTAAEVEVTVGLQPSIRLVSSRGTIEVGEETTLSWTVEDADSVTIHDPAGALLHTGSGDAGSLIIHPEVSGAFLATATGKGGEAVSTAQVSIRPVVDLFSAVTQGEVRPGNMAQVQWDVRGAEEIILVNQAGYSVTLPQASGSMAAPVGTGGGFALLARSGAVTTEAIAVVAVTERPLVHSLTTSEIVTAGRGQRGNATVRWKIDGAAKIQMDVSPGGLVDLTDKNPRDDEVGITLSGPGTITLTAINSSGTTVVTIPAPVDPVPAIDALFAAPSRVGSGESVEIHWRTLDAETVILEQDGVSMGVASTLVDGSHATGNLAADSTYVLRAFNGLGFEVASQPLSVPVGSPNVLSFDTSDGRHRVPVDSTVRLEWANDGGSSLTVTDQEAGQVVCSTSSFMEIRKGGCNVIMPSNQVDKPYLLTVTNNSGVDTEILLVQAVTGPMVDEFITEFTEITQGDNLLFSWVITPDADGNIATEMTLQDNLGNVYDMTGVSSVGSKRFRVEAADDGQLGIRTFTLMAGGPGVNLPLAEGTTEVMVYGIPRVGDIGATPSFAEAEGDPIEISWTSTHGAALEIFLVDRQNNVSPGPVYSTAIGSEVGAGIATVHPTVQNPSIQVVVANPLGVKTSKNFRIGVDPATIVSFTASEVDLLAGEELTLTWETARTTERLFNVSRGEFFDVSASPTARNVTTTMNSVSVDSGHVVIPFPDGFEFPFGDTLQNQFIMAVDGWTSFGYSTKPTSTRNSTWPMASVQAHLIPFQNDLYSRNLAKAYWDEGTDPEYGRYLVFQWKNWELWNSSYAPPMDLNFQVVLFEDGAFDFRYGLMRTIAGTAGQSRYNAYDSQIAFQHIGGTKGRWVKPPNQEVPGGLNDRSFSLWLDEDVFFGLPPASGSTTFTPDFGTEYTLRVKNGHSDHEMTIPVRVHPKASLVIAANPAEPAPGQQTTLEWQGGSLTSLVIEDSTGAVIHTASPGELTTGSLSLGALAQGDYSFTLRAVGMVARDQIVETVDLFVYDPFSLDSFEVSGTFVKVTELPVVLSWETTNATSVTVTDKTTGTVTNLSPADFDEGSLQMTPERTTTYLLTAESHGRFREAERTVEVRTVWIDDFTSSTVSTAANGTVSLGWSTTGEGKISLEPGTIFPDMQEIAPNFEDISGLGQAPSIGTNNDTGLATVNFPAGFTFPYFGVDRSSVRFSTDGWLSFDTTASNQSTNQPIPNTSTTYNKIHMPIFWDDLYTLNGRVDAVYLPNPDRFIVQWTNLQRYYPSSTRGYDLNFQIVLFPNGSFEYRYGTMAAPSVPATSTSDCNPLSCVNETNGSSATVGYQNPAGTMGHQIHYAGTVSASNPVFPGGPIANRTFRWAPFEGASNQTVSVQVPKSGTYTLCIEDEDWKECESIDITVFHPGDLQITEMMLQPSAGGSQWFEIRNLLTGDIDLHGWTISTGSESHIISEPLLVPAGAYVALASSPTPGFTPDYVYGNDLTMTTPAGSLEILSGGTSISKVTWTSAWSIVAGKSLELDPARQRRGLAARTSAAEFCEPSTSYDGVDFGTPAEHGKTCSNSQYTVDFYAPRAPLDISAVGQIFPGTGAYLSYGTTNLGFSFPFYGAPQTQVSLSSCGFLAFGTISASHWSNVTLPSTATPASLGVIAAFWDDLNVSTNPGMIKWAELVVGGQNVAVFDFVDIQRYNTTGSRMGFQIELWENGEIVIAYRNLTPEPISRGSDATIGIQAPTSVMTNHLLYSYNQASLDEWQVLVFTPVGP